MDIMSLIFLMLVGFAIYSVVGTYNTLVPLRESVRSAEANFRSSLQRKMELAEQVTRIARDLGLVQGRSDSTIADAIEGAARQITVSNKPSVVLFNLGEQFGDRQIMQSPAFVGAQRTAETLEAAIDRDLRAITTSIDVFHRVRNQFPTIVWASFLGDSFGVIKYPATDESVIEARSKSQDKAGSDNFNQSTMSTNESHHEHQFAKLKDAEERARRLERQSSD